MLLPDEIKRLQVRAGDMQVGSLVREDPYGFTYDQDDPAQLSTAYIGFSSNWFSL